MNRVLILAMSAPLMMFHSWAMEILPEDHELHRTCSFMFTMEDQDLARELKAVMLQRLNDEPELWREVGPGEYRGRMLITLGLSSTRLQDKVFFHVRFNSYSIAPFRYYTLLFDDDSGQRLKDQRRTATLEAVVDAIIRQMRIEKGLTPGPKLEPGMFANIIDLDVPATKVRNPLQVELLRPKWQQELDSPWNAKDGVDREAETTPRHPSSATDYRTTVPIPSGTALCTAYPKFRTSGFPSLVPAPSLESPLVAGSNIRLEFDSSAVKEHWVDRNGQVSLYMKGVYYNEQTALTYGVTRWLELRARLNARIHDSKIGLNLRPATPLLTTRSLGFGVADVEMSATTKFYCGASSRILLMPTMEIKLPLGDDQQLQTSGGRDLLLGVIGHLYGEQVNQAGRLSWTDTGEMTVFSTGRSLKLADSLAINYGIESTKPLVVGAHLGGSINWSQNVMRRAASLSALHQDILYLATGLNWRLNPCDVGLDLGAGLSGSAAPFGLGFNLKYSF